MDTLNQLYSDILTTLNRPLVDIKEFDHDSNDVYFTMRNSEDISITLRMKKTLSRIIEKHFVPGKRLFIHFSRSAYDIENNGSNTLDVFYYVKYEEIVDDILNVQMNDTLKKVGYVGHHNLVFTKIDSPSNTGSVELLYVHELKTTEQSTSFNWNIIFKIIEAHDNERVNVGELLEVDILKTEVKSNPNPDILTLIVSYAFRYIKITKQDVGYQHKGLCCEIESPTPVPFRQHDLCIYPETLRTINTTGTLNDCFQSINPVYIGLEFSKITSSDHRIMTFNFNGIFEKTKSTIFDIISRILKILSEPGYDLTVDIFEIHQLNNRDLSMRLGTKDEYTVWTRYALTKHNRKAVWTEPVICCPYIPKHLIKPNRAAYVDYPTANFYQIETLCPIDEFDYWKAIGEEILSIDDVDEAVKFHKQFYHSKQKFRLVKIQKQLLGEV